VSSLFRRVVGERDTPLPRQASAFTPDSLSVASRHLEVGGEFVASFVITGYPREVHPGWLQPLLTYPGRVDVSLHIEPIDPVTAAHRLKRQLSKLESGRQHTHDKGRLLDPTVEAATEDAYDLSSRVARGEGKLYRVGLYLTVHAATQPQLADEVAAVRSLAASLLLNAQPTTYRALQGWVSTLPLALDRIGMRRTFDTAALAAAFPFTSPDLPPADPTSMAAPDGVLYGFNLGSQSLVHWDRFAADNHNSVILGRSGSGKSYLVKLETLRSLYRGVEVTIIDPEDEYRRLCHAVGGTYINLGATNVRLNPFDLPITSLNGKRTAPRDALTRRALFLHTVIAVLLRTELSAPQSAVLDRGVADAYQRTGITSDPRTWNRPAPLLADLTDALTNSTDPIARDLGNQLHPFAEGAFANLFAGPTTTPPDGHLLVFSLRDLADELKPIGTLLTLDAVWRRVTNPAIRRPRLVTVDEAWLLMQDPNGARYLHRMAKAIRKHWGGLTFSTQDAVDLLGTPLGKAIIANAATQILLRQAPQAIDEIADVFHLSGGEKQLLLTADRGQGLLCAGTQRTAFQSLASPEEDTLITTDPAQLVEHTDQEEGHGSFVDIDVA
jgi:type IV secretory pathway VirB4 component